MAKMITRTFTGYNVNFITGYNQETNQPDIKIVYVASTKGNKDKAIKEASIKMAGLGIYRDCEYVEEIRGMTIEEFFTNSKPVKRPPSQQKKTEVTEDG